MFGFRDVNVSSLEMANELLFGNKYMKNLVILVYIELIQCCAINIGEEKCIN